MILAAICRKNIEPMKERERMSTTKGSLGAFIYSTISSNK
jgi:hypothetical protein